MNAIIQPLSLFRGSESRCPKCGKLLTKIRARLSQGDLSDTQYEEFKKGVHIKVEAETKCRWCKVIVSTAVQANM